jgi:thiamine biosynthesis protein ThiS
LYPTSSIVSAVRVNGNSIEVRNGTALKEFLISSDYDISRIAVELNGEIVPKKDYDGVFLKNSDSLEIVSFVGGG